MRMQGQRAPSIVSSLFGVAFCCVSAGCGVTQPKYIDYAEEDATVEESPACIEAQATFDAQMQPGVAATCAVSGCHVLTAIKGAPLVAADSKTNRRQLKAYASGSADTLFNKYSATGVSHGGGSKGTELPKANVDAWLAKEAACQ